MTHRTKDRLWELGCLAVLISLAILSWMTATRHWFYAGAGVLLVFGYCFFSGRYIAAEDRAHLKTLEKIFRAKGPGVPTLRIIRHYGFADFTIAFSSETDFRAAMAAEFNAMIQERYAHDGFSGNPFEADKAVHATWEGHRYL